ncbi:MAG: recombination regulator RecX [Gammaproteobacteria bacterium]|nr:recombination regulator RecX [Gammaproteobacteria bacterium]MCD8542340.1 recombination regulator RecX [Gammaproteobacteria bacterium]
MSDYKNLVKKTIALLALREHSRYELQQKLLRRGYSLDAISFVVDDLIFQGLQSDRRFAESYACSRASRGYGPQRIYLELQQKGVDDEVIQAVMEEIGVDWLALAKKVYDKKFGRVKPSTLQEKLRRQNFIRYRGFSVSKSLVDSF